MIRRRFFPTIFRSESDTIAGALLATTAWAGLFVPVQMQAANLL